MYRMITGAVIALMMVGIGLFWRQGRAQVEEGAPPPEPVTVQPAIDELPQADVTGLRGPALPEVTELSREQKRFFHYNRNRDLKITRPEMLSSRTAAFRKLDQDGSNLLTFKEWAVATVDKFEGADSDGNRDLSPEEFATTAPKRRAKPACRC